MSDRFNLASIMKFLAAIGGIRAAALTNSMLWAYDPTRIDIRVEAP